MRNSGEMTIGQIAKLILAVVVVIFLLTLATRLISPIFDRGDETAKSYMNTLESEIKVADSGEGGEFFMWYLGDSGENKEFYLVYFGETIEVDFVKKRWDEYYGEWIDVDVQFNSFGSKDNRICVCAVKDYESTCKYCGDLDHPVSFKGKGETWYEASGKRIDIKLEGERYVFSEIK